MPGKFNWQVRVYYEDTDAAGIVFYANYLRYMERARTEWLRSVGYEHEMLKNTHGILFAVKNVSIEYVKPACLDDLLTVSSSLLKKRGASLIFKQAIKNTGGFVSAHWDGTEETEDRIKEYTKATIRC